MYGLFSLCHTLFFVLEILPSWAWEVYHLVSETVWKHIIEQDVKSLIGTCTNHAHNAYYFLRICYLPDSFMYSTLFIDAKTESLRGKISEMELEPSSCLPQELSSHCQSALAQGVTHSWVEEEGVQFVRRSGINGSFSGRKGGQGTPGRGSFLKKAQIVKIWSLLIQDTWSYWS